MPERFRVVCIPYKALYKCSDLPFTFTLREYGKEGKQDKEKKWKRTKERETRRKKGKGGKSPLK